jgi:pyridoxal phosphate enzyme (YggS family)
MNAAYSDVRARVDAAAQGAGHPASLLAVSKTKPAPAIRALAALGQRAFGENYVQEALAKQRELTDIDLEWHLIGPLQSNKCREVAQHFDWLQSLDRGKLVEPLNRFRAAGKPLNVLIQVNIDAEASKSGCAPDAVFKLAQQIAMAPNLRLRGLMAIPEPAATESARRSAFRRMRELFDALRRDFPQSEVPRLDTLSMGMSDDFELAIAEGATMVRVGTALFGARG